MECYKCGKETKYNKKTELHILTNDGKDVTYFAPCYICQCGEKIIIEEDMEEASNAFDRAYNKLED